MAIYKDLNGHCGNHLGAILDIPIQICLRVILMYFIELLTCENLYFATDIIVISAPEQKL